MSATIAALRGVMGGEQNQVTLVSAAGEKPFPVMSKTETARLAGEIAAHFQAKSGDTQ